MTIYDFLLFHLPLISLQSFSMENGCSYRYLHSLVRRGISNGHIKTRRLDQQQGRPLLITLTPKGENYVKSQFRPAGGTPVLARSHRDLFRAGVPDR